MNKVININFQGRILPIEEQSYDVLKQYIESLRVYFANEEGRDEIINDIECRVAELCDERLKKGTLCITQEDMNLIITSIGRPADFEAQDGFEQSTTSSKKYMSSFNSNSIRTVFCASSLQEFSFKYSYNGLISLNVASFNQSI